MYVYIKIYDIVGAHYFCKCGGGELPWFSNGLVQDRGDACEILMSRCGTCFVVGAGHELVKNNVPLPCFAGLATSDQNSMARRALNPIFLNPGLSTLQCYFSGYAFHLRSSSGQSAQSNLARDRLSLLCVAKK